MPEPALCPATGTPLWAPPGTVPAGPSQVRRPLRPRPHGRGGTTGRPSLFGDGGALRRAPISPYPYPTETGDRRSEAILRPVGYPKCPGVPGNGLWAAVTGCGTSNQAPAPALWPARYSAQSLMSRRRRSNRSVRRYATSTWLRTLCASAASGGDVPAHLEEHEGGAAGDISRGGR